MGVHIFASYQDFLNAQDNMAQAAIDASKFNFTGLALTVPDQFDDEVTRAIAGAQNESEFSERLLERINNIESSGGSNPNPATADWIANPFVP